MIKYAKFGILGIIALMFGLIWFDSSHTVNAVHDTTVLIGDELVDPNCLTVGDEAYPLDSNTSSGHFIDYQDFGEEISEDPTCRGTCVMWGLSMKHLGYVCLKKIWKCYYYGNAGSG